MIGETILHYKILEKLGEGGMGIVYLAEDTKLKRIVALKFLPDRVNQDKTAKDRFLHEAQSVAALNHSHICTIYGIEEYKDSLFMIMEFLEGGTLDKKIPFQKINEALTIALQIGDALQEAHSKGIVHRDIKADNVMLTAKGEAKVMDFGLAKLKGALKITRTSSTVGTLGYMSPEQIQGGEVDHRSDIFSFGVLFFEMLTGKLPFRGEHEAAIVYSVVNEEPEILQTYLPEASTELQHILSRALEKDPEDRYQSAADMVSEIKRLLKHSTGERKKSAIISTVPNVTPAGSSDSIKIQSSSKKNLRLIVGGAGIIILGIILFLLFFNNNSGGLESLNPNMKFNVLSIPFGQFAYPSLSNDGKWLAFPAANSNEKWDYYFMHITGNEIRRVSKDSISNGLDLGADISPDGSQLLYVRPGKNNKREFCIVSTLGGVSKTIVQNVKGMLARWRPDGKRIGYIDITTDDPNKAHYSLWSVKPDGSDNRNEFQDSLGTLGRYSFRWSPDGKSIVWIRSFPEGYQEVITHNLENGEERQLTFDKKNIDDVAWTNKGLIIFSSNRGGNTNLWAMPVKGGTFFQITKGAGPDIGFTLSENAKTLIYLQRQQVGSVWVYDLNTNTNKQITFDDRNIFDAVISPDGKKVAFAMGNIDPIKPGADLYVQDTDGNNRRQLTDINARYIGNINWSLDGGQISFYIGQIDSAKIYTITSDGSGESKYLTKGSLGLWLNSNEIFVTKFEKKGVNEYDNKSELVSPDGKSYSVNLPDSIIIVRSIVGNMLLMLDFHFATRGLYTISNDYLENPLKVKPRLLMKMTNFIGSIGFSSCILGNDMNNIWKIDYKTGQKQKINIPISATDFYGSDDNSKLVYIQQRLNAKLVLIENIFK